MKIDINTAPAPLKTKDETPLLVPAPSEIWVRNGDDVHRLCADLMERLEDFDVVNLACIGAGCLNQAVKAIAVARERMLKYNEDLVVQPYFSSFIDDQDRNRTRIVLRVFVVTL